MADGGNIKVVVRCRPLNSREKARGASYLIDVTSPTSLVLSPPPGGDTKENARATKKKPMPFSFDRMFPEDTEQFELFDFVGEDLLQHAFAGFNTCVFAYGQTGSGKSHSMVGYAEQRGLIPLTCSRIFEDINKKCAADPNLKMTVEVSYMEIYNEKVHDLLNPKNKGNLKVREHPSLGPYVEDLSRLLVNTYDDIDSLLDEGNKARTIASTNMNATSSRSHAVITLILTQKRHDVDTNLDTEKVSRISLVDLAGSERANSTGATGDRLKEGANINRSLTTLGKVIAALAGEPIGAVPKKKGKKSALDFIPYRDSILTWLLKDSLGGNSKTAMIAAISPADYEETLSTLRYADQAKKIQNKAVVNEDPNAKLIRELKEELELLRAQVGIGTDGAAGSVAISSATAPAYDPTVPPEKQVITYQTKSGETRKLTKKELQEQLEQSEKLMQSLDESWEDKMARTDAIHRERERALEELGISISHTIAQTNDVGLVHTPKSLPHLVNLNEDPLMNECLIYQLKMGKTYVGNDGHHEPDYDDQDGCEADSTEQVGAGAQDGDGGSHKKLSEVTIPLSGTNIQPLHCVFTNEGGKVTVQSMPGALTMVNGQRLEPSQTKRLRSGYRLILGDYHVFRFNHPEEVRKARDRTAKGPSVDGDGDGSDAISESENENVEVDWSYARAEAALAKLNGENVDFGKFDETELEKLMEDVRRARIKKRGTESLEENGLQPSGSDMPLEWPCGWDDGTPWGGLNGSPEGTSDLPSTPAGLAQETQLLRDRVRLYERRLAETQEALAAFDPLTSRECAVARLALAHWHMPIPLRLARDLKQGAPLVTRATRAAVAANKDVQYQLTIYDREPPSAAQLLKSEASSARHRDHDSSSILGLEGPDDLDPDHALSREPRPCVAVQVLDRPRGAIFVWSLNKLEATLERMERVALVKGSLTIDPTTADMGLPVVDPFTTPASIPSFCFIGSALVPLLPLAKGESTTYAIAPFRNAHTNNLLGTCRVRLTFRGIVRPRGTKSTTDNEQLPLGARLALTLEVDEIAGLETSEFVQAHLQVRRESLTGEPDSFQLSYAGDRGAHPLLGTTASQANLSGTGPYAVASAITSIPSAVAQIHTWRNVRLRKAVDVLLTPASVYHLTHGYLAIELFASFSPAYFARMETMSAADVPAAIPNASTDANPSALDDSDPVGTYHQSVVLYLEIHELGESGDYEPVQVVPLSRHNSTALARKDSASSLSSSLSSGSMDHKPADTRAFFLRQGSQRKLVVRTQSEQRGRISAHRISTVKVGDVCLVDIGGNLHKSSDDRLIPLTSRSANALHRPDGTAHLDYSARWDFTSHHTLFLDRITRPGEYTSLKVQVEIEASVRPQATGDSERYTKQILLGTTLQATVHAPDAVPSSSWLSWMGQAHEPVTTVTELFDVQLVPRPLSYSGSSNEGAADDAVALLTPWDSVRQPRLWRPRRLSLLRDFSNSTRKQVLRADVDATRVLLDPRHNWSGTRPCSPDSTFLPKTKGDSLTIEPLATAKPSPLEDVWADSAATPLQPTAAGELDEEDPWTAPDPWQSESSPASAKPASIESGDEHRDVQDTPPSSTDRVRSPDSGSHSHKLSRSGPVSAEEVVALWRDVCREAKYNRMDKFHARSQGTSLTGSGPISADSSANSIGSKAMLRPTVIVGLVNTLLASAVAGSRQSKSAGANRRSGWVRVCADPVSAASGHHRRVPKNSGTEADPWPRVWTVLFGPHLLFFNEPNPRRRVLQGAVRIDATSQVEISTELGRLCRVPPVLSLYTSANSYLFFTRTETDLHGWMLSLQSAISDFAL